MYLSRHIFLDLDRGIRPCHSLTSPAYGFAHAHKYDRRIDFFSVARVRRRPLGVVLLCKTIDPSVKLPAARISVNRIKFRSSTSNLRRSVLL